MPAYKVHEIWDCEPYPGFGRVISQMRSTLSKAEYAARELADEFLKNREDKGT